MYPMSTKDNVSAPFSVLPMPIVDFYSMANHDISTALIVLDNLQIISLLRPVYSSRVRVRIRFDVWSVMVVIYTYAYSYHFRSSLSHCRTTVLRRKPISKGDDVTSGSRARSRRRDHVTEKTRGARRGNGITASS